MSGVTKPQNKQHRRKILNNLEILEKKLNYSFADKNLLKTALSHKSSKLPKNNERLEFLGDAVMDLIVGEFLFFKFKNYPEGDLSKLRAALVNEKSFAKIAIYIKIGENLFLSPAENNNGGRFKESLLSDAFEAIMGAIYLESGLENAKKIALDLLLKTQPDIDLKLLDKDHKTALQELTQGQFGLTPSYELISAVGPDHKKEFTMAVFLGEEKIATAKGNSKKDAEQKAAGKAIEILKDKK